MIEPDTRAKIIQIIKRQCFIVFKPDYEKKCDQLVDENIDHVMDLVKNAMRKDLSPAEVCGQLGACSKVKDCKFLDFLKFLFVVHARLLVMWDFKSTRMILNESSKNQTEFSEKQVGIE